MILKETLKYYRRGHNTVHCTMLDATKAFDRVEYHKLVRLLLYKKMPAIVTVSVSFDTSNMEWHYVQAQFHHHPAYSSAPLVRDRPPRRVRNCCSELYMKLACLYSANDRELKNWRALLSAFNPFVPIAPTKR